ncbi:MAG TPA: GGDEF domain-containing protein [Gammaproteobacteria bacterium]|nr:GGDEF domain-containing protein [Gammaproteobacteria bacterium]
MAVYVFVGVAFIVGLICASVYGRVRRRIRERGMMQPGQPVARLAAIMQRLDQITWAGRASENQLGETLLDELATTLDCKALAFYVRDDVEFRVNATHDMDAAVAEKIRGRLEADANLAAPTPQTARIVKLEKTEAEYALTTVARGRQTGVIALQPSSALNNTGARGLVEGAAGHALMRLEALRLRAALKQAATQDAVTHLHNQRYFLELLELEFNRSLRYQRALSVLLCGIDSFTDLNSRDGNHAGDAVLRQIANAFRGSLRYFDVVGRYEADTLAVLLPEADRDIAVRVAERLLRAAGAETGIDNLVMNIGVANVTDPTKDFTALLKDAREALQAARKGEGNQVRVSRG